MSPVFRGGSGSVTRHVPASAACQSAGPAIGNGYWFTVLGSANLRVCMAELILYSTEHCTLCDRALELLFSMPELAGRSVRVVDVADDEWLTARYGERLPVLTLAGSADRAALDWPFVAEDVLGLMCGR